MNKHLEISMSKSELGNASEASEALASITESQRKMLMRTVLPWWGDVLAAASIGLLVALELLKVFDNGFLNMLLLAGLILAMYLLNRRAGVKLAVSLPMRLLIGVTAACFVMGMFLIGRRMMLAYGDQSAWLIGLVAALGMFVVLCAYRFYVKRRTA